MNRFLFLALFATFFIFSTPAGADTTAVFDPNSDTWFKFWVPSDKQFSVLMENIKSIIKFEIKNNDTSEIGKKSLKIFQAYLQDWGKDYNGYFRAFMGGIGKENLLFYRNLKELVRLSDQGDQAMLQSLLIAACWPLHAAHSTGNFKTIWSDKKILAFYAAHNQPDKEKTAVQKAKPISADENNMWQTAFGEE